MRGMANCKSCGAEILWVKTENGKSMPLSVATKEKRWINQPAIDAERGFQVDTYLSHFSDCPNAAQHRTPKDGN